MPDGLRGWRAWYDDGTVYSSADRTFQALPAEGALGFVLYFEPPYREVVAYGDWYYLAAGEIHRIKTHPEWGQWADPPAVDCASCVKKSGVLSDAAFDAVLNEMMEAREWP